MACKRLDIAPGTHQPAAGKKFPIIRDNHTHDLNVCFNHVKKIDGNGK
jgi:hypothetical protein